MKRELTLVALSANLLLASGYKIPEQSLNSFALSAAYAAGAYGADTAYFNPANMVFEENDASFELSITNVMLPESDYSGTVTAGGTTYPATADSESESPYIPNIHYTARIDDRTAYGLSVVVPGGLTKRWKTTFQKLYAEEFGMRNIEINPTLAYKLMPGLSVAGGVRLVQSQGVVKSSGTLTRDLEGTDTAFGYNAALTYKPLEALSLAATYRSLVTLEEEGNAKLYYNDTLVYDGAASVAIPLPATLTLGAAYTFGMTTVELTYDKTYWSAYEELDFTYGDGIDTGNALVDAALVAAFDDPKDKSWKDTSAYRIGVSHRVNPNLTVMAGYARDENPVPERTLQFELPDADATVYSAGMRYTRASHEFGFSLLRSVKEKRTVHNDIIDGTFAQYTSTLVTLAYGYRF